MHALLYDPGGFLVARLTASRIAAFRLHHNVGFPSFSLVILCPPHDDISGLYFTACILAPSSFILPLLALHVDIATDLLARL